MKDEKPVAKGENKGQTGPGPIEERVGTHAAGMVVGAAGGALAGAIGGMAAGPLGSLAGAIGGAVLGGASGAATGGVPNIDTSAQEMYWRQNYASRPYVATGTRYDDYESAYRYGTLAYARSDRPREWQEVEAQLGQHWESVKGNSRLEWSDAKQAVRDAWERMHDPSASEDTSAR